MLVIDGVEFIPLDELEQVWKLQCQYAVRLN